MVHTVGDEVEGSFVAGGGGDWASSARTRRMASREPGEDGNEVITSSMK